MANGPSSWGVPAGPPQPSPRRHWRPGWLTDRRVYALCGVVAVVLVAELVMIWRSSSDTTSLDAPRSVEVGLEQADGDRPAATVSFDVVSDAEAYLVELGGDAAEPVRVEPSDCDGSRCALSFDRLTAVGASDLTVTAVAGTQASEPSEVVELPEWPSPGASGSEDEPVVLVITRAGAGGDPVVETEPVEPGDDLEGRVEARIAELEQGEGVLDVAVQAPPTLDTAQQEGATAEMPEGWPTWQELAWTFEDLPGDPRGSGITIGVVEAGVDAEHPALRGADVSAVNVREPDEEAPVDKHGTMVTSMIVGQPGSSVPGIAPGATVRVYGGELDAPYDPALDDEEDADYPGAARVADAIRRAVDDGVDLVITSVTFRCLRILGVYSICPDEQIDPAVQYAEDHGVVVVAAAGNDAADEGCILPEDQDPRDTESLWPNREQWPARLDTVIAAGGVSPDGSRYTCSPDKGYIDVLAPATAMRVATPSGGYQVASGTSFAAPLVAGLVAIVLSERPDLSPADVRAALHDSLDAEGQEEPSQSAKLVPLHLLRDLGVLLDEPGVTAAEAGLSTEELVSDYVWPRLEDTSLASLDANPQGGTGIAAVHDVLGEPTITEPTTWGSGSDPQDPRPTPGEDEAPDPPDCWSTLYGLEVWEQDGAPLLGVLYAREEVPLDSGDPVPAGAVRGYRVYQDSATVQMADVIAIGQTRQELEDYYVDSDGRPYREVSFVGDSGEFELVNVDSPVSGGRETSGALGPNLGRMSGQSASDRDTILERGAGYDCAFDLVPELAGEEVPDEDDRSDDDSQDDDSSGDAAAGPEVEVRVNWGDSFSLSANIEGPSSPSGPSGVTTPCSVGGAGAGMSHWTSWSWESATPGTYTVEVVDPGCVEHLPNPEPFTFTLSVIVDGAIQSEGVPGSVEHNGTWSHDFTVE